MVKFDATKAEMKLIQKIARRAVRLAKRAGGSYDLTDAQMDITATHANGTPLDLAKLAAFDDFNFAHDVFGIRGHIDRTTGKLTRCFLPRCAR